MICYEDARALIIDCIKPLGDEDVPILDALGRVVASEIAAPRDVPHEDNSAMDGFAVRHEDVKGASGRSGKPLTVVGESRAGKPFEGSISQGEAVSIMTGGVIPRGADTVVMFEHTSSGDGVVFVLRDPGKGANIRLRGEYIRSGEIILRPGDTIGPPEVGLLATIGQSRVKVYRRPVVAVLSTGDELVDLDSTLGPGQVFSSNAYSLAAQIMESGAMPMSLGIARDDEQELVSKLREGLAFADVVVTSGGVSEGRHDLVKQAFATLGLRVVFWKVAIKPGKPVLFGTMEEKPIFGLPGNPGATLICFEQFVRPALLKMMGHKSLKRLQAQAVLADGAIRQSDRLCFLRCRLEKDGGRLRARLIPKLGVGLHRTGFYTDGLMVIPPGNALIEPGDTVEVQILRLPDSDCF